MCSAPEDRRRSKFMKPNNPDNPDSRRRYILPAKGETVPAAGGRIVARGIPVYFTPSDP